MPTTTMARIQTIQIGSRGEAVKKAQKALIERYYLNRGGDDGIFGPRTDLAVRNYQNDRSPGSYNAFSFPLEIDGIVGPKTWFRLDPPLVKNGSQGDAVKLLQEILKRFNYPPYDPGPVDSIFGNQTENAVKEVQRDFYDFDGNPLEVDGIVGPKTWRALFS